VKIRLLLLLALTLSLMLAACGPAAPQADTALPTRTPRPTFTPTPVGAAPEPVILPTDTPAAQAQPDPAEQTEQVEQPAQSEGSEPSAASEQPAPAPGPKGASAVVTSPMVNVRSGPGTQYDVVGQVDRGNEFQIVGKNAAGDWWQLCCVSDRRVWIAGFLVDTTGPVDSVAVASDIPAPPPTATPRPVVQQPAAPPPAAPPPAAPPSAAPPEPEPAPEPEQPPAPAFALNKAGFIEPRSNSNQVVSFFGVICKQVCPGGGVTGSGYRLVVEGPHGRSEVAFGDAMLHGDPGLASEFIYNVKLEITGGPPGSYRAYVVDSGGNQVSEAWEYTAQGDVRTFLPRWILP
jgi:hypothetical protein